MSRTLDKLALILIDVQNSFVSGRWGSHFGFDVSQIQAAYSRCSDVLQKLPTSVPVLLTQCPFQNQVDRDFHKSIKSVVTQRKYPVVYKYDTNIMDSEGIREWMDITLNRGITTFIIGGCTTTSCVRVSSTNLRQHYNDPGLEFVVDLSLCGARDSNYVKRCQFCMSQYMRHWDELCGQCDTSGDVLNSPVDLAVESMTKVGVKVMDAFDWNSALK